MKASEASVDQLDPGCLGPTGTMPSIQYVCTCHRICIDRLMYLLVTDEGEFCLQVCL